jgi:UPF0176 protein
MKEDYTIILYYKYTPVENPEHLAMWHRGICGAFGFKGRILIAKEGINGTLEGTTTNVEKYMEALRGLSLSRDTRGMGNFRHIDFKRSVGTGTAFPKMKIKVKSEIVSVGLGVEDVNPNAVTGKHLPAKELKKWYEKGEEFYVVDMRNDYEYKVGHFKNSVNPGLENSRDLPKALPKLDHLKDKKVLTVCTGGIRCEKMSGYLLKKGFKDVYQLDGGMHSYMEKFPGKDFLGTLYTFDNRVVMDFGGEREVIAKCDKCSETSERYVNCADPLCHKHIICCEKCSESNGEVFCSESCKEKILEKRLITK